MSVESILAPLFVLVALTFVVMFWSGRLRIAALRRGDTNVRDIALGQSNWPPQTIQAGNCLNNQFQLPVLFYVLVILAFILHKADLVFVILSWAFVITRIVHAYIHTTSNDVNQRFTAYTIGAVVLLIMWIIFAVRILLALG
jgi:hypothetical protein